MNDTETVPPSPSSVSPEQIATCIRVLESILDNRALLAELPASQRRSLLIAAGRVSRPDRLEFTKLAKARRRSKKRKEVESDRAARAATQIREVRTAPVYLAPSREQMPVESRLELKNPRHCYVCKAPYRQLHFFYDSMCAACARFNYAKRFQSAPVIGRTAVITGARIKIGFQAALMLLRAGARVIVTTRFPKDAAQRFGREKDFSAWCDRLHIFGLDLRHAPSVELFCEYLNHRFETLDFLINNAAQTVRRPPGFYRHLMETELAPTSALPQRLHLLLSHQEECHSRLLGTPGDRTPCPSDPHGWLAEWSTQGGAIGLRIPASLSQLSPLAEDARNASLFFPDGKCDSDLQQLDLREMNSWRLRLADVPTPELLEVQLVNAIAPYLLCARLKPLMMKVRTNDKHIVNVSAMEGKFSRHTKTDKHPHTNMAKAALNMMTLTSAPDYARDGIFMNAVDTGWVTDEDPAAISARKRAEHDFQPPLDIVDGAARVCDPIFSGLITGNHVWGKFLKDYFPTSW